MSTETPMARTDDQQATLTDEEIETVWSATTQTPVRAQDDADGSDADGTDGDAGDTGDGDAGDGDATDSGDSDAGDGADADGQDA